MLTTILFLIGFFSHTYFSFIRFYDFMEKKEERTIGNFILIIGLIMGLISMLLVHNSIQDLLLEFKK